MIKKHILIFVLVISLLPVCAMAEKVIFVSPVDLPPKIFVEGGQLKGTYVDIIREVCKHIDVEPVFRQYPWKRCVKYVKTGKAGAIFPPFLTKKRTEYLYFPTEPVSYTRNVVFGRKNEAILVDGLKDLKGLIVGVNWGYSYGAEFDEYKENLSLEYNNNEEMQIKKLAIEYPKRMDVAIASEEPFIFLSKKLGVNNKFAVVYVLSEKPSYVAFSKAKGRKGKMLSDKFNKVLRQLKMNGTIERIYNKYLK